MEARNVVPAIPMRKSRKLRVAVDRILYRVRNLVERCFNKLKNARRVATRYDTLGRCAKSSDNAHCEAEPPISPRRHCVTALAV